MTIHSSKGLEFNTVFLAGFEDGRIPIVHRSEPVSTIVDQFVEYDVQKNGPFANAANLGHVQMKRRE